MLYSISVNSFHNIWVDIYELRNAGEPRRDFYTIFVVSLNRKTNRRNYLLGQIIADSNRISLSVVVRIWSISFKLVTLVKIKLALPTIRLLFEQPITVIMGEIPGQFLFLLLSVNQIPLRADEQRPQRKNGLN